MLCREVLKPLDFLRLGRLGLARRSATDQGPRTLQGCCEAALQREIATAEEAQQEAEGSAAARLGPVQRAEARGGVLAMLSMWCRTAQHCMMCELYVCGARPPLLCHHLTGHERLADMLSAALYFDCFRLQIACLGFIRRNNPQVIVSANRHWRGRWQRVPCR